MRQTQTVDACSRFSIYVGIQCNCPFTYQKAVKFESQLNRRDVNPTRSVVLFLLNQKSILVPHRKNSATRLWN